MEPSAPAETVARDPFLPRLLRVGDIVAPLAPQDLVEAGLEEGALVDLVVKLGYTVARFSTDAVAKQLQLSLALAANVLEQACREGLLEETMQSGVGRASYKITERGREHARRVLELCGYLGPAPVRLEAY